MAECGAVGSAGRLGRSGRRFESCHSDLGGFCSALLAPACVPAAGGFAFPPPLYTGCPVWPHRRQITSSAIARYTCPQPSAKNGRLDTSPLPHCAHRALAAGALICSFGISIRSRAYPNRALINILLTDCATTNVSAWADIGRNGRSPYRAEWAQQASAPTAKKFISLRSSAQYN